MKKHILFVGGGTVGHIAPLLAVMEQVQAQGKDVQCSYVGLPSDLTSPVVTESKLKFEKYAVRSGKLHRHLTWNQLKQFNRLFRGILEARKLLTEIKPDLIFAKGGYSTVPVIQAAVKYGIPIFCHETDVVPGLANRIAARHAKVIFTSYPVDAYTQLPADRLVETGQPVRDMFYKKVTTLPKELDPKLPVITVIGGTQGGRRMNHLVADIWEELLKTFQIVQVTGALDFDTFMTMRERLPKEAQNRLHLESFMTKELPSLFQNSAVVISRAGGTIAELAASRACTILVPLSTAAQNHQMANATILKKAGATVIVDETVATPAELLKNIREITKDTREQTGLRAAIGHFDHPDAAKKMAAYLLA
jgi:UDP-N-acetylglucosamine--N-acetylmuramyl-(pentapeptide) pyrophosphoryl-undecaprenol N-acetylglucosamine transferase